MKIKQVEYKKLFNLGNFEHEEIGIIIEPEIKQGVYEDPDVVISDTIDKVENIHKATHILQKLHDRIDTIYTNHEDIYRTSMPHNSVTYCEDEIKEAEQEIERYKELQKDKEMGKESKQHFKEQLDDLKQYIKKYEEKMVRLQEEGTELLETYQSLKSDFKQGIFSAIIK